MNGVCFDDGNENGELNEERCCTYAERGRNAAQRMAAQRMAAQHETQHVIAQLLLYIIVTTSQPAKCSSFVHPQLQSFTKYTQKVCGVPSVAMRREERRGRSKQRRRV